MKKKVKSNNNIGRKLIFGCIAILGLTGTLFYLKQDLLQGKIENLVPQLSSILPQEIIATSTTYKLLITGDIFLDRHIDELSQKSPLKYAYPFQGLYTLEREKYDAWIGNLECPVTEEQSTKFEKSEWLKFSCKKEYLPELAKYFDIVSLANNHTDNMGAEAGLIESRKHLDNAGIKYFGHYDNAKQGELCKVINIPPSSLRLRAPLQGAQELLEHLEVAFCGFNGVYKLPTEKELEIIKKYSDKYLTIAMPHQGEEYKFTANTYQKKLYRKMIDNGADVVFGAHPHVVQNVEEYKGKKIFYSLGNFIFDQSWAKTREHMVVDMEITITSSSPSGQKPNFTVKYTEIPTHAGLDFITRKK